MSGKHTSPNVIAGDMQVLNGHVTIDNSKNVRTYDSGATVRSLIGMDNSNNINVGSILTPGDMNFYGGTGRAVVFFTDFAQQARFVSAGLVLNNDGFEMGSARQVAQVFAAFDMSLAAGSAGISSYGVSSYTDNGVGDWTVTFSNTRTNANYAVSAGAEDSGGNNDMVVVTSRAAGNVRVQAQGGAGTARDTICHLSIFDNDAYT